MATPGDTVFLCFVPGHFICKGLEATTIRADNSAIACWTRGVTNIDGTFVTIITFVADTGRPTFRDRIPIALSGNTGIDGNSVVIVTILVCRATAGNSNGFTSIVNASFGRAVVTIEVFTVGIRRAAQRDGFEYTCSITASVRRTWIAVITLFIGGAAVLDALVGATSLCAGIQGTIVVIVTGLVRCTTVVRRLIDALSQDTGVVGAGIFIDTFPG